MPMRLHEVHPALAHFPVALLPTAIGLDAWGRATGDEHALEAGRRLMPLAVGALALTGLAGFVAQGATRTERAHDLMITHRNLNVGLLAAAAGLALWRARRRRPSGAYLAAGLAASALVTYTGYLGGRMVYGHGVGVEPAGGVHGGRSPEIGRAPGRAGRIAGRNAAHAARHAAHHLREGHIAPAVRRSEHGRDAPAGEPEARDGGRPDLVDTGSEMSFPASDPPAYMGGAAVAGPPAGEGGPRAPARAAPTDVAPHAGETPAGTGPARGDPNVRRRAEGGRPGDGGR
ncbi:DUF2231 domain-containing protein [Salinarimonas rosea]|uniref:DUF2231 domain-containing protein n=1 Tax=Salinarimonas rosea TaxID=552063 RepID=UPI00040A62CE|nr:DUF2231 domain-containing protein [Salinarimonas rosea]